MSKDAHLVAPRIVDIRGQRVVLDAELARLYGVTTRRFNEAFKRKRARFPQEFAFQLTPAEFGDLKSQIVTSSLQPVDPKDNNPNRSQIATGSQMHRYPAILKGLAEIDATLLQHDSALRDLYKKLLPLLQPPADPPKRRIDFHSE